MAASPNKAVSPKDYTVCIGRQTSASTLTPSTIADFQILHDLRNIINSSNIPSYSIVGEYMIAYPQSVKDLNLKGNDYYINCVYMFDESLFNKCRYIRLVITPNISYTNISSMSINIFFNVEIECGSALSGIKEIFNVDLPPNVIFNTQDKKYAVIYDLEKNEIYKDTDDPIEEWSDSNQLEIYV